MQQLEFNFDPFDTRHIEMQDWIIIRVIIEASELVTIMETMGDVLTPDTDKAVKYLIDKYGGHAFSQAIREITHEAPQNN